MLPHEKALVERLKDKPFALIGINSDGDTATVRKLLAEQGITWRNAIDVSTEGPWARAWNVSGWPTIYVLDHKGVIRHRGLRDEELETVVNALLKELEAAK